MTKTKTSYRVEIKEDDVIVIEKDFKELEAAKDFFERMEDVYCTYEYQSEGEEPRVRCELKLEEYNEGDLNYIQTIEGSIFEVDFELL